MPTDVIDPLKTDEPVRPPSLGFLGALRWAWRQLTSMRTALFLLFMLAVAAIPGSVFPQRGVAPLRVGEYFQSHPTLAPILDDLSLFDVYAAPWFAAIYLLLMVSLAGCILPRCVHYAKASRAKPPATPRNLARLPVYRETESPRSQQELLDAAAATLRDSGFRVDSTKSTDSVAAEKGYLHEFGNLVFHVSLLVILVGVSWGALLGYRGTVVVIEDEGFSNLLTQYDDFTPGRRFDPSMLAPFSFTLDSFDATFIDSGPRLGQPSNYLADVTYRDAPGSADVSTTIKVNEPLVVDGTKIYLLGHGYAPRFTVRDGDGNVVFQGAIAALPQDPAFTSKTAVKVPDAQPEQLGFNVTVTPTAPKQVDPTTGPVSTFPEQNDPRVYIGAWAGDLGLDSGVPQNVYELDTTQMKQIGLKDLREGQTWNLPGGRGSITFDGLAEFGNFQIAHDPGRFVSLLGAVGAITGIMASLIIKRRRIWVRVTSGSEGRTLVEVAGLARTEAVALAGEVDDVLARTLAQAPTQPAGEG
ncbi:MAG TPA: cytochrome c biogenesis protein ResB [Actinomycetes bacterium]|nr:cytochrome c biogenesis protein ResB [Actinomycetes bacterium]